MWVRYGQDIKVILAKCDNDMWKIILKVSASSDYIWQRYMSIVSKTLLGLCSLTLSQRFSQLVIIIIIILTVYLTSGKKQCSNRLNSSLRTKTTDRVQFACPYNPLVT